MVPEASAAGAHSVVELDAEAFARVIHGHPFVVVDFWAPWCAPCRAFTPEFEAAAKRHPAALFAKVNTEKEQAIASYFNIRSIPMLMVFRDDVIVFAQPGALNASALDDVLSAAGSLDMDKVRQALDIETANQAS